MILKIKILKKKKKKKIPGDYILLYIHVYHKLRSYDIWFLKYKVKQTEILVILGHFLPFQFSENLEHQNLKIEKNTWRHYHFTHLHHKWKSYDVCFLRYGAQQTQFFVILDRFLPFYPLYGPTKSKFLKNGKNTWGYHHFKHVYHKWQSYDVWFLRYGVQQMKFFVILGRFLPFYSPNNPKNQNFEKMRKTSGDITSLHMRTINDNHMMYGSWDMELDRQIFLSFWTIFCSFTPLTTREIKFWKTEKKVWRYHHFTQVYQKSWWYAILFLRYGVWQM